MAGLAVASDGHRTSDGRAAWAYVCSACGPRAGRLPPGTPSHLAEWRGAAEALAHLEGHAPGDAVLRTDAALVAKGLAGRRPEMAGEAAEVRAACRQALARLAAAGLRVAVERVDREANAEADAAARAAATSEGPPQGPSAPRP